jgi:Zn-finger nucleic acid-binding protein
MSELQRTRIEPSICPFCGVTLELATGRGVPEPGALSVCSECGEVSVFSADLTHRALTRTEIEKIMANVKLSRKIAFFQAYSKPRRDASALN